MAGLELKRIFPHFHDTFCANHLRKYTKITKIFMFWPEICENICFHAKLSEKFSFCENFRKTFVLSFHKTMCKTGANARQLVKYLLF